MYRYRERNASVEDHLDALLRAYRPSLAVFYDAYLACDDAFMTALTAVHPGRKN